MPPLGVLILYMIIGLVSVGSAVGLLVSRSAIYSALFLVLNFLTVALLYLVLGAPFIALAQISVYAGAIMVLFVFVVMMLNLGQHTVDQERKWLSSSAWAYPALMSFLMGLVLVWMLGSDYTTAGPVMGTTVIGPKAVGQALFTHYLLLVEVAAMLLLAALVGAFHLGKREPSAEKEKE